MFITIFQYNISAETRLSPTIAAVQLSVHLVPVPSGRGHLPLQSGAEALSRWSWERCLNSFIYIKWN